jgi:phenylalanyl-tRNA synthetase alpha chain
MEKGIKEILAKAKKEIESSSDLKLFEDLKNKYLGRKKGELNSILRKIKDLAKEEKPRIGELANRARKEIESALTNQKLKIEGMKQEEKFDYTLPGKKQDVGHLHPLTLILRKVTDIFVSMGFEVVLGPEVELAKYNFDLLNIPKDHPSRDVWDTFYIGNKGKDSKMLLRTHTSPVQIRAMEKRKPSVRLIVPGRVFRHEATDSSHETTFYQVEGLVIDQGIRITDLIGTLKSFLQALFGSEIKIRVRPHFYPFTEPSMDIDMSCILCQGKGCSVCGHDGWLEMLGSGMVHPRVLKNMKIDPKEYTGFAFGLGIDRIAMLYYQIDDIRLFYQGDLRFLKQF